MIARLADMPMNEDKENVHHAQRASIMGVLGQKVQKIVLIVTTESTQQHPVQKSALHVHRALTVVRRA